MIAFIISLIVLVIIIIVLWRFKWKARFLPTMTMIIMIAGIIALSQPWIAFLYHYGLAILMVGVIGYIFVSHFE